jgi:hypothetical protein
MPSKRLSQEEVKIVAEKHIASFSTLKGFEKAVVSSMKPVYAVDGKTVQYYEAKISSPGITDNGYVIVSTDQSDLPIVEFAHSGKSNFELLQSKSNASNFKMIRFSPNYFTAEDANGKLLAEIGRAPMVIPDQMKKQVKKEGSNTRQVEIFSNPKIELKESDLEATALEYKKLKSLYKRPAIKASVLETHWKRFENEPKKPNEVPVVLRSNTPCAYDYFWADGINQHPYYLQISANTAPNNTSHASGCGPTAWMNLCGWHDRNWTNTIFPGDHQTNDSYINDMTMRFHDYLGTMWMFGQGFTAPWDMDLGYGCIANHLSQRCSYWYREDWWNTDEPWVFEVARDSARNKRPFIVGYYQDMHYAIGYGIAECRIHGWRNHSWIYIYPAWDTSGVRDKWIPMDTIFGIWTAYQFSQQRYKVTIKTGNRDNAGTDANVYITLYGTKGNSGEIYLDDPNRNDFERSNTDVFNVCPVDLGNLTKIRLRHDNSGMAPGWYVDEVKVLDKITGKEWLFPVYRWFARDEADGRIDVTFNYYPAVKYVVSIRTGNIANAGTDANVYMTLNGNSGSSGEKFLDNPGHNDFERGNTDSFNIFCPDLGELSTVRLRHDNSGISPGWFVGEIKITNTQTGKVWTIPCNRWWATDEDDRRIDRTLTVPSGLIIGYTIKVKTSDRYLAGTDANVYITLNGSPGQTTGEFYLDTPCYNDFERGNLDTFSITRADLGDLTSIRIRHDNSGSGPGWHLQYIQVLTTTGKSWMFNCNRWLATDEDDHKIDRTLAPA